MKKLHEILKKLRRRPPAAGDSVNKKFTDSFERGPSTYMPSQQDRPRH
jgi:hypothetical protein